MATRYRNSESTTVKFRDEIRAQSQTNTRDSDVANERHMQDP